MAGFDRRTGRLIGAWPHTQQAIATLLTTAIGDRQMRGWVGSLCPPLLGEHLSPETITRFVYFASLAIALHEPRFVVRDADIARIDRAHEGEVDLILDGDFRPGALRGDYRVVGPRRSALTYGGGVFVAAAGADA